jgi:hypothetical protein
MADKRKAPDAADAARKRKAPTIDLTATDVTPVPAAAEPPSPAEPVNAMATEPASEAPPPPPPEEPPPQADAGPEAASRAAPAAADHAGAPFGAMLAAGIAGGVIVAAALGGAWYAGLLPANTSATPDTQTPQQIAKLQQQIAALQNRPAPSPASGIDPKTIDALTQRVAQTETALKNMPAGGGGDPQLGQRLASVESAIKSGDTAISTLNKRIDDIAANATQARQEADAAGKAVTQLQSNVKDIVRDQSGTVTPAQIDSLQQRLTSLEQAETSARESAARSAAAASATRLALAAQALRNAIVSGAPYPRELAQANALGADAGRLERLQPFAATGVPSAASLAQQLRTLLPQIRKIAAPQAQATGSFLERLQANAGKLVHISPVNAPAGDDASDVLARLEVESAHNDIAAAAADIGKLPEAAQAPAKDWLARVKARAAALAAADDLAADTARALTPVAR